MADQDIIPENILDKAREYHLGMMTDERALNVFESAYFTEDSLEWKALYEVGRRLEEAYLKNELPDDERGLFEANYHSVRNEEMNWMLKELRARQGNIEQALPSVFKK